VKKGLYREKLFCDKDDSTILGEGPEETVITFSDGAYEMLPEGRKRGMFRSYTLSFLVILPMWRFVVRQEMAGS